MFITGHSLGGAFAQQLAYAFPSAKYSLGKYPGLKISKVIVFDPSPVNGWYWVDPEIRERNAGGLPISRIYQHGEILAYLRLSLSYVYPPSDGNCVFEKCSTPKIEEVRYNALYRPPSESYPNGHLAKVLKNPIGDHSMRALAAGLATAAGHEPWNVQ
jgi:pimeloyl-ACP methyl ester carboxylesterase